MNERTKLERNIRLAWVTKILEGSPALMISTIVLFWTGLGMSMGQILAAQAVYTIVAGLLEIPTGYFGDRVSRRRSVLLGFACGALGFGAYALANGFVVVLAVECALALANALISGSRQALVYDTLVALGRAEQYARLASRLTALGFVMMIGYAAAGSVLYELHPRAPLAAIAVLQAVLFAAGLGFTEPPRRALDHSVGYLAQVRGIVRHHLVERAEVRWILLFSAAMVGCNQAGLWFYQRYLELCGVPTPYFGAIFAAFNVVACIASLAGAYFSSRTREGLVTVLVPAVVAIGYVALACVVGSWSFAFIFLHQVIRGVIAVVGETWLNREVESESRATVNSIDSMLVHLVLGVMFGALAMVSDGLGLLGTFGLLAGVTIAAGIVVLALRPARRATVS